MQPLGARVMEWLALRSDQTQVLYPARLLGRGKHRRLIASRTSAAAIASSGTAAGSRLESFAGPAGSPDQAASSMRTNPALMPKRITLAKDLSRREIQVGRRRLRAAVESTSECGPNVCGALLAHEIQRLL